jgi:hypothetical protein
LFNQTICSSFILFSFIALIFQFFNNTDFNFSIFSAEIHLSVKFNASISVFNIECFPQEEHSISIFIVDHAAQIISTFASVIHSEHSGHL